MRTFLLLFYFFAATAHAQPNCNLKAAGFHHPKSFEAFFTKLQAAAAAKDGPAIARLANYPLRIGDDARIENETELKKKFESVFTPAVLRAITGQKRSELRCDLRGAVIGDGLVWIQEVEGVVVISAINEAP